MTIRGASVVVILVVLALSTTLPAQEAAPRGRWWDSPAMQTSLHLTRDQVKQIDTIFDSTLRQRQALRKQLDALEDEEQSALSQATLDDAAAMRLIEHVESVRAQRNTSRALLLYRIRQVLTPDQRRWFDHRNGPPSAGR